ncbi:hypothetical protein CXF95_11535 [Paraglaciecola sp. MB-3u-78]|jgi:hypothetical protein|nr:hypothetical protein CXF95_11535 [Paraglaciecola sp. MB-3u-78]
MLPLLINRIIIHKVIFVNLEAKSKAYYHRGKGGHRGKDKTSLKSVPLCSEALCDLGGLRSLFFKFGSENEKIQLIYN